MPDLTPTVAQAQATAAQAEAEAQAAEAKAQAAEAAVVKAQQAPAAAPAPAAPAPAPSSTATLALKTPAFLDAFGSGVDGWGPITRRGTSGPAASADQVIAAAQANGVELEAR